MVLLRIALLRSAFRCCLVSFRFVSLHSLPTNDASNDASNRTDDGTKTRARKLLFEFSVVVNTTQLNTTQLNSTQLNTTQQQSELFEVV